MWRTGKKGKAEGEFFMEKQKTLTVIYNSCSHFVYNKKYIAETLVIMKIVTSKVNI
jgi:hypothetical protein